MERTVYVIGHRNPDTDSVCSAIAYARLKNRLGESNVRPARAGDIDPETEHVLGRFGVPVPPLLTDAAGLDLILVDHNEVAQALPHIDAANVLEVWEHHRIGDLRLPRPIVFHCEPLGATATLIAEVYAARDVPLEPATAGILLASILSDTVGLRSPTTTEKDRNVAARLASIAGVDPAVLGDELLHIKSAAAERKPAARIVRDDLKEFALGPGAARVGIAQVEVARPFAFADRKPEILREMRAAREAGGLTQLVLMITDVETKSSELWFVGDRRAVFEHAFGPLVDDAVRAPGCMSRKKQVVPRLEHAFFDARARPTGSSEGAAAPR